MMTFAGMAIFSLLGALSMERFYNFIFGTSTDGVVGVGRWAAFTGTWTAITTASGVHKMSNIMGRLKDRTNTAEKLVGRNKGKLDGDL